jgi:hypothetical protein
MFAYVRMNWPSIVEPVWEYANSFACIDGVSYTLCLTLYPAALTRQLARHRRGRYVVL